LAERNPYPFLTIDQLKSQKNLLSKTLKDLISKTKGAENTTTSPGIQLSPRHYEALIEKNFDAILLANHQGELIFVSQSVLDITGYQPFELLGRNTLDFTHPEDARNTHPILEKVAGSKQGYAQYKHRIRFKDDKYYWIEARTINHLSTPGMHAFVTHFRNVDQEEKASLELKQLLRRHNLASKACKDVIWDWDFRSGEVIRGENFSSIFRLPREAFGTIEAWERQIHPADLEAVESAIEEANQLMRQTWSCNYRFKDGHGNYLDIEDQGYILRDDQGQITQIIGAMRDVSHKIRYRKELRKREEKFRQLFERSLLGMGQIDLETGTFCDCNQALINILGYSFDELLEKSVAELTPPEYQEIDELQFKKLKRFGASDTYHKKMIRKDQRNCDVITSGFYNSVDEDHGYWINVLDISQLEQTTKALHEAESRFKDYIEKASDVLIILDEEAKYEYASPNIYKLLGYQSHEIIGRDNLDFIHPDDHTAAMAAFEKAFLEPGTSTRSVFRALQKNGSWRWVEANGTMYLGENGDLKSTINIRDKQKEHQAEQEIKRLSLVADKTTHSVLITDKDSVILWCNSAFSDMTGYKQEEAIGQKVNDLLHREKTTQERFKIFVEKSLESGEPFRVETTNEHKQGYTFWVESHVTPIKDDQGKVTQYIAIETDITERRRRRHEIENSHKLTLEQNRRLKNFTHILSHKFRAHAGNILQISQELTHEKDTKMVDELHKLLLQSANELSLDLKELGNTISLNKSDNLPIQDLVVEKYLNKSINLLSRTISETEASVISKIAANTTIRFYPAYLASIF
jgi:PAS domain S-box-containing protein